MLDYLQMVENLKMGEEYKIKIHFDEDDKIKFKGQLLKKKDVIETEYIYSFSCMTYKTHNIYLKFKLPEGSNSKFLNVIVKENVDPVAKGKINHIYSVYGEDDDEDKFEIYSDGVRITFKEID